MKVGVTATLSQRVIMLLALAGGFIVGLSQSVQANLLPALTWSSSAVETGSADLRDKLPPNTLPDRPSPDCTATASAACPGQLATARTSHTATLLTNGKVLVAGGIDSSGSDLASTELYDPATGAWASTGSLGTARSGHTATLLGSGKVLVAGGSAAGSALTSAELYDPSAGTWSATGALSTARFGHTATLLTSGKVLVAGGFGSGSALSSAELFDPTPATWSATGSLGTARYNHTATLLTGGKVLVAGGIASSGALSSAELFDPTPATWSATGSLGTARYSHTATLLNGGKVLVAGGDLGKIPALGTMNVPFFTNAAERYDPATGTWTSATPLPVAVGHQTASLLSGSACAGTLANLCGRVLVSGGETGGSLSVAIVGRAVATAQLYDPVTNSWILVGPLSGARYDHTATVLADGRVLAVGGTYSNTGRPVNAHLRASTEVFQSAR